MKYYFLKDIDERGKHEVHSEDCIFFPFVNGKKIDGDFTCCADAIEAAKSQYPHLLFDGCRFCSPECHTG